METRFDKKVNKTNQAVNLHVRYDFSSFKYSWESRRCSTMVTMATTLKTEVGWMAVSSLPPKNQKENFCFFFNLAGRVLTSFNIFHPSPEI